MIKVGKSGTWVKCIPPKMMHDTLGIYQGQWMPEMDRCWIRKEDGTCVSSRLLRTDLGNVEHVTITRHEKGSVISFNGESTFTWKEKQDIKNDLFGENRTAVEVFPTEDRLIDTADVYHLWVFDKKYKLPFGIHPKEFKYAVNRGYNMTQEDLKDIQEYYDNKNMSVYNEIGG